MIIHKVVLKVPDLITDDYQALLWPQDSALTETDVTIQMIHLESC